MTQPKQTYYKNNDNTYDSRYALGDKPGAFVPLIAEDFSSGTLGATYPGWHSTSVYADDQPELTGRSLKTTLNQQSQANLDIAACGGSQSFCGRSNLPIDIPIGKKLWISMERFHPVTQSWGYCYDNTPGDYEAATICGQNADGPGILKDMVLAPSLGFGRIYLQPSIQRRNVAIVPNKMRISCEVAEAGDETTFMGFPLGEWFTSQLFVHVQSDGTGIIRAWINGILVNEFIGPNVGVGSALREWGMGDYWNGVPYTDGAANRGTFWIKQVIAATDVEGYGAPNGLDNMGNIFIDPSTKVADL